MTTIQNFTTTKSVLDQLKNAGVEIKLHIHGTNLRTTQNPFEGCVIKDACNADMTITPLIP